MLCKNYSGKAGVLGSQENRGVINLSLIKDVNTTTKIGGLKLIESFTCQLSFLSCLNSIFTYVNYDIKKKMACGPQPTIS